MDTGNALLYDAAMRTIPRRVAAQIIYWNVVLAVLIVCLAAIAFLHRIHRFDTLIVQQAAAHRVHPAIQRRAARTVSFAGQLDLFRPGHPVETEGPVAAAVGSACGSAGAAAVSRRISSRSSGPRR